MKVSREDFFIRDILKFALIAALIVIPVRVYIAKPFIVSGSSMIPAFSDGDWLVVDELSYNFREPERGEIVIFRFPKNPSKFFIKRIVGLPGETLEIKEDAIFITSGGITEKLDEPYVKGRTVGSTSVTLSGSEYFVLGDNRVASSDSRVWGPLPLDLVVGRVLLRFFPLTTSAYLPGNIQFDI